ncbi:MAG: hemolysin family protein [Bacteroidota bacterium]
MNDLYSSLFWIFITLIFIGFFAGYEIAFISANRLSIELKKKQGRQSGILLSKFMHEPAKFIGSCLVGLNIFLVIYGLLFTEMINRVMWNPLYTQLHIKNDYVRLVFDTFLSTIIVLVFGEFIPKAIFKAKNDILLSVFAPVANLFNKLFTPFTNFFVSASQWILKYLFNINIRKTAEPFSLVDLEHFYKQTKDEEESNPDLNKELFENALSLPNVKIRQCLVPRTEIEAIDITSTIAQLTEHFSNTKLSKLIIYQDNIDEILGYVHQLDLFKKPATIKDILLPIPIVPETMSAADLINKFSKERKSIAWVVDEFGGTSGIVTMEDVLEEIFGEIHDEYDTEDFVEKQVTENEYIFSGRLELDFLNEKYSLEFPESESETLSGYIIQEHESIPQPKETIFIGNYRFDIINVTDKRIEMVKLKRLK